MLPEQDLFNVLCQRNFFTSDNRPGLARQLGGKYGMVTNIEDKYAFDYFFFAADAAPDQTFTIPYEAVDFNVRLVQTTPKSTDRFKVKVSEIINAEIRRREICSHELNMIDFLDDDGNVIKIDPKVVEEFRFCGLNNTDFITSGMYEEGVMKDYKEIPSGWISIEDHLPKMLAIDFISKGFSTFKAKYADGSEFETHVSDHDVWYVMAKGIGITHWWND